MNKEIEELLNKLKECRDDDELFLIKQHSANLLLSYIEQLEKDNYDLDKENQMLFEKNLQLETDYKEANESVTWWTNRYNAIVKQNDDNHKKVVKLENNRDKAIEYVEEKGRLKYNPNELINLLKGGSDE